MIKEDDLIFELWILGFVSVPIRDEWDIEFSFDQHHSSIVHCDFLVKSLEFLSSTNQRQKNDTTVMYNSCGMSGETSRMSKNVFLDHPFMICEIKHYPIDHVHVYRRRIGKPKLVSYIKHYPLVSTNYYYINFFWHRSSLFPRLIWYVNKKLKWTKVGDMIQCRLHSTYFPYVHSSSHCFYERACFRRDLPWICLSENRKSCFHGLEVEDGGTKNVIGRVGNGGRANFGIVGIVGIGGIRDIDCWSNDCIMFFNMVNRSSLTFYYH